MDACTAFGFVFNSEPAHKYVGAKTLAQETQVRNRFLIILKNKDNEQSLNSYFPFYWSSGSFHI